MKKPSQLRLEQQELRRLVASGLQPVRTVLRALALRQLATGQTVRQVAKNVALTPKTVWRTSQRFRQGGLERALYERPRPGKAALLDAQQRQRIVALVCGPPPEGRGRWTVRLLTEEVVKRKLRHSTVAVTQNCYIKTAEGDVVAAMRSLESAPNMHLGRVLKSQLM